MEEQARRRSLLRPGQRPQGQRVLLKLLLGKLDQASALSIKYIWGAPYTVPYYAIIYCDVLKTILHYMLYTTEYHAMLNYFIPIE